MKRSSDWLVSPSRRRFLWLRPSTVTARISRNCLAMQRVECRICVEHCPHDAIEVHRTAQRVASPVIIAGRCTGCGDCVAACPTGSMHIPTGKVHA